MPVCWCPLVHPKPVINRISTEVQRILAQPDIRERIAGQGFDVIASTPEQFAAQIRFEVEKWGKVIRSAGIRVD